MKKIALHHLPMYQFDIFEPFSGEIQHAVFTRQGGVSKPPFDSLNVRFSIGDDPKNVTANRNLICGAMEIQPKNLISADQTHSKNVWVIDDAFLTSLQEKYDGTLVDAVTDRDAFVTNIRGVTFMIQVADCQAIVMFDPVKKVIAAVHAGWKGLVQDIIGETIKVMCEKFQVDPATICVGVAPSLGPCCAQFSDPENEIPAEYHSYIISNKEIGVRYAKTIDWHTRSGLSIVNLWQLSVDQLQRNGVLATHIELTKHCTSCSGDGNFAERKPEINSPERSNVFEDEFYSFRREKGSTGRFGVLIHLKAC